MRQLATIQKITELNMIPNADQILVAKILGWHVVVRKADNFSVGDLVVYAEVDSLFPQTPEFEFLKDTHYRIRTRRFRGQISQGIVFPLSILDGKKFSTDTRENPVYEFKEGMEVSDMLGIAKYEPPIPACLSGIMKGNIPGFLQKTDETRVQVLQPLLDKYKGTKCYVSEKVDGGSTSYFFNDGGFGVCSRNLELTESSGNAMWKFAREKDIEAKMKKLGMNIAIQGEIVGVGINKNHLNIKGSKVLFFNVYDIDSSQYLDFEDAKEFITRLGLEFVPIISTDYILGNDIDELVKFSIGKSLINPAGWREGIVIRPLREMVDCDVMPDNGGRISLKVVNPNYLLEVEE